MKKLLMGLSALGLFLAGCEDNTQDTEKEKADAEEVVVEETEKEEVKEEAKEEVKEEESTAVVGKRSNPVPLGQEISLDVTYYDDDTEPYEGVYVLKITDVIRGEEAFDILLEENQFNEEAPEGMEWVIIELEGKLLEGDEDVPYTTSPWFQVIDSKGGEISQDEYGTLSGNEYGYTKLFPGGETSGRYSFYTLEGDDTLLALEGVAYFSLKK